MCGRATSGKLRGPAMGGCPKQDLIAFLVRSCFTKNELSVFLTLILFDAHIFMPLITD